MHICFDPSQKRNSCIVWKVYVYCQSILNILLLMLHSHKKCLRLSDNPYSVDKFTSVFSLNLSHCSLHFLNNDPKVFYALISHIYIIFVSFEILFVFLSRYFLSDCCVINISWGNATHTHIFSP